MRYGNLYVESEVSNLSSHGKKVSCVTPCGKRDFVEACLIFPENIRLAGPRHASLSLLLF